MVLLVIGLLVLFIIGIALRDKFVLLKEVGSSCSTLGLPMGSGVCKLEDDCKLRGKYVIPGATCNNDDENLVCCAGYVGDDSGDEGDGDSPPLLKGGMHFEMLTFRDLEPGYDAKDGKFVGTPPHTDPDKIDEVKQLSLSAQLPLAYGQLYAFRAWVEEGREGKKCSVYILDNQQPRKTIEDNAKVQIAREPCEGEEKAQILYYVPRVEHVTDGSKDSELFKLDLRVWDEKGETALESTTNFLSIAPPGRPGGPGFDEFEILLSTSGEFCDVSCSYGTEECGTLFYGVADSMHACEPNLKIDAPVPLAEDTAKLCFKGTGFGKESSVEQFRSPDDFSSCTYLRWTPPEIPEDLCLYDQCSQIRNMEECAYPSPCDQLIGTCTYNYKEKKCQACESCSDFKDGESCEAASSTCQGMDCYWDHGYFKRDKCKPLTCTAKDNTGDPEAIIRLGRTKTTVELVCKDSNNFDPCGCDNFLSYKFDNKAGCPNVQIPWILIADEEREREQERVGTLKSRDGQKASYLCLDVDDGMKHDSTSLKIDPPTVKILGTFDRWLNNHIVTLDCYLGTLACMDIYYGVFDPDRDCPNSTAGYSDVTRGTFMADVVINYESGQKLCALPQDVFGNGVPEEQNLPSAVCGNEYLEDEEECEKENGYWSNRECGGSGYDCNACECIRNNIR